MPLNLRNTPTYAGSLPFFITSVCMALPSPWVDDIQRLGLSYTLIIFFWLGAYGDIMPQNLSRHRWHCMAASSLISWITYHYAPMKIFIGSSMVSFAILYIIEHHTHTHEPYMQLRRNVTLLVLLNLTLWLFIGRL